MDTQIEKIDILNRDEFIDRVIKIIGLVASNKGNTTFAINGKWGCGKTFVLNKVVERITTSETKKYLVVPYNCWQYDYYQEPLVAVVAALNDFINENKTLPDYIVKSIISIVGNVAKNLFIDILKNKTGIDASKAVDFVKESIDKTNKNTEKAYEYDSFFKFKEALNVLKENLEKISDEYTVLFVVDELDRCLPEYAIKVLERLHHITEDVPNVITIVAVDKEHLENTINSIFGKKTDDNNTADLYLKKFIKFEIDLDYGKQNAQKFSDKYPDFCSRFDSSLCPNLESTEGFLEELFDGIDIRSQEQIIKKASIAHDLCFYDEKLDCSIMYAELFFSTIYFHFHNESIFEPKRVYDSKRIFNGDKFIPQKFNCENSGFNLEFVKIDNRFGDKKMLVDANDIFMIIFYYWYSSIPTNHYEAYRENEFYPICYNQNISKNLEYIKEYLNALKLLK